MFEDDHPSSLWARRWSDTHDEYLERMGFALGSRDGSEVFERPITLGS